MDLREARLAPGAARRHPWEIARADAVRRLLLDGRAGAPATILDVGCGDAYVAQVLAHALAARCACVDTGFTPDDLARLRAGLSTVRVSLHGTLDEGVDALGGPADAVLLLDVLEHVEDDQALLARLRQSPAVGARTRLLVTVPAHQALFGSHDALLGHYRRYAPRELAGRLAAAGFVVEQTGQFFLLPLLGRVAGLARERLVGARPGRGVAAWGGGPRLTRLAAGLLRLDVACGRGLSRLGLPRPGLSSYALCRISAS